MANRHLSRSIVLQALFEWDFSGKPEELKAIIDRDITEFAPGHSDAAFMYELAETVQRKQVIIDDIIMKAAPEWPLEKISNVDRNILRLGLAELLFGDREQVPPKVAINESIELAKNFGGEPGKDQLTKPKVANKLPEEPIDISKLVVEAKAGGIVHARHDGVDYVALVHDVFGYWTLPKGGLEEGETNEQGGQREIEEKLGIKVTTLGPEIGAIDYVASHPEKGKIRKVVTFYLAEAAYQELDLHSNGGLDKAAWFQLHEVVDLTIYDDILPLIAKAIELIS